MSVACEGERERGGRERKGEGERERKGERERVSCVESLAKVKRREREEVEDDGQFLAPTHSPAAAVCQRLLGGQLCVYACQ